VFQIASGSKQFLAAGIMILVRGGKAGLDDSVRKYLRDAPPPWRGITIRQMLGHNGGLARDAPAEDFSKEPPIVNVIWSAYAVPLQFRPSEQYQYANIGYYLIAEVLTRASGERWTEFMDRRIFRPPGMTATRPTTSRVPNRATGYEWVGGQFVAAAHWGLRPSGAYLVRPRISRNGTPLSTGRHPYRQFRVTRCGRRRRRASTSKFAYGFGWQLQSRGGTRAVYHGGGRPGFKADFARFPDDHLSFIVLTNAGHADPARILWKVATAWLPGVDQVP
jgi:D-alanyl-D-alanine carboxypeptidase